LSLRKGRIQATLRGVRSLPGPDVSARQYAHGNAAESRRPERMSRRLRLYGDVTTGEVMDEPYNGMPATALGCLTWLKSRHSNPSGNCVEVACLPNGEIAVRNSRHPAGPALVYTRAEIAAFLQGAKEGEFDRMLN
jgi:hypothetical protein